MSEQGRRANQIFISYRRDDSAAITGRLYDRLVQKFGRDAVFKDVDSIPLGVNFRKHMDSIIDECAAVLVVIGDKWAGQSADSDRRRLDDPRDLVRIEVESALRRDVPVIPLLVQNAELPPEENLPQTLRELAFRNGMSLSHDPYFNADVNRLITNLESILHACAQKKRAAPETAQETKAAEAQETTPRPESAAPPDATPGPTQRPAIQTHAAPYVPYPPPSAPPAEHTPPKEDAPRDGARPLNEPHEAAALASKVAALASMPAASPRVRWYVRVGALAAGFFTAAFIVVTTLAMMSSVYSQITDDGDVNLGELFGFVVGEMFAALALGLLGSLFVKRWPVLRWRWGVWLAVIPVNTQLVLITVAIMSEMLPFSDSKAVFIPVGVLTAIFMLISACLGAQFDLLNTLRLSAISTLRVPDARTLVLLTIFFLILLVGALVLKLPFSTTENTNTTNTTSAVNTSANTNAGMPTNFNANTSTRPMTNTNVGRNTNR